MPFALPVDAAKFEAGRAYSMRAYIAFGGSTRFITTTRVNIDPTALPASLRSS